MTAVKFVFKSPKPISKIRNSKSKILEKGVIGTVIFEDKRFIVYSGNDKVYEFTKKSFDCTGKKIVFVKVKGKWNKIIRDNYLSYMSSPPNYYPFKEDSKVKGNVVDIDGKQYFDFKSIIIRDNEVDDYNIDEIDESSIKLNEKYGV